MLQLARAPGSALPPAAPSDGVITGWSVAVAPEFAIEAAPLRLKVFRATGNPGEFRAVGESVEARVGRPAFRDWVRIPVLAGDRLGLYGSEGEGILVCSTGAPEDSLGMLHRAAALDSVHAFEPVTGLQVAVSATLEPDLDQDGYGDETQDGCPQLKSLHSACFPSVGIFPPARRHSILAVVTASYGASVNVTGTVHLDSRRRDDARTATAKGLVLRSGTHAIETGEVGRFSLKFSTRLEALLRRMPPRETVNVTVKAFATGLNGERDYDVDGVRLKGRGRRAAAAGARLKRLRHRVPPHPAGTLRG